MTSHHHHHRHASVPLLYEDVDCLWWQPGFANSSFSPSSQREWERLKKRENLRGNSKSKQVASIYKFQTMLIGDRTAIVIWYFNSETFETFLCACACGQVVKEDWSRFLVPLVNPEKVIYRLISLCRIVILQFQAYKCVGGVSSPFAFRYSVLSSFFTWQH